MIVMIIVIIMMIMMIIMIIIQNLVDYTFNVGLQSVNENSSIWGFAALNLAFHKSKQWEAAVDMWTHSQDTSERDKWGQH